MNTCFSPVRTLLFDYGGTLDTDGRHWAGVLWEAYTRAGVPVAEASFREAYVYGERYLGAHSLITPQDDFRMVLLKKVQLEMDYLSSNGLLSSSFSTPDVRSFVREIAAWCDGYVCCNMRRTHRILSALKTHYALGLVSNFYGNLPAVLKGYGLFDFFDTVVESAAVGIRKPSPAIYALGLERMEAKASETVVIGDSFSKDILPGRELGCKTIWLKGETWKPEHNDESLPDAIISEFDDLKRLL